MLLENNDKDLKDATEEVEQVSVKEIQESKKERRHGCDLIIKQLLTDNGVCKICTINFTGPNYGISLNEAYGEYNIDELESEIIPQHCFSCLGILEGPHLCAVAKSIAGKLEEYDAPTFTLNVSLPTCTLLRRRALMTYVIENVDNVIDFSKRNMSKLKNLVKFFLAKFISKLTNKTYDQHSDLTIAVDYIFPDNSRELSKLDDEMLSPAKKRKLEDDNENTKISFAKVIARLSQEDVKSYALYPPQPSSEYCKFNVKIFHSAIFFAGSYNRYCTTLSQTWEEGAGMKFIGEKLKELTCASDIKFTSSGMEDLDVKILGGGKPFVVELTDSKVCALSQEQVDTLLADVNSPDTMTVHNFQKVNRAGLDLMKKGEVGKVKTYKAKLICSEKISDEKLKKLNQMKDIELKQLTPISLLHKSPSYAIEGSTVFEIDVKRMKGKNNFEAVFKVSAGTHVKAFAHGDFGRTEPSLTTILDVPIDIDEVAFMHMDLIWPPVLDDHIESIDSS